MINISMVKGTGADHHAIAPLVVFALDKANKPPMTGIKIASSGKSAAEEILLVTGPASSI